MRRSNIHTGQGRIRRGQDKARQKEVESAGRMKEASVRGNYHNDYSPRYTGAYDIYDKARSHVKALHQSRRKDPEQESDETGNMDQ